MLKFFVCLLIVIIFACFACYFLTMRSWVVRSLGFSYCASCHPQLLSCLLVMITQKGMPCLFFWVVVGGSSAGSPTKTKLLAPLLKQHPRLNPSLEMAKERRHLLVPQSFATTPMPGFRNACLAHSHLQGPCYHGKIASCQHLHIFGPCVADQAFLKLQINYDLFGP